jgi:uncharacterized membrane protein (DUF2068 family)
MSQRESFGGWLGLRWAEYLTVVATTSFVPIEIFEVLHRLDLVRVGALALNLAVIAYLGHRLRLIRRGETTSRSLP